MEFLILIITAGAVMAIILTGVSLVCKRIDDYCALDTMRRKLLARLAGTRLGGMLGALGIELQDYVHGFSVTSVEKHLEACEHCGATQACDHFLEGDTHSSRVASTFCPNMKALDRLAGK